MSKRKLLLDELEGKVLATVGQEGCDPHWGTLNGNILDVLPAIPDFLKEAEEKWAVSPKNPAYKAPAAPKKTTPPAATASPAKKAGDLPLLSGTEKPVEKAEATEAAPEAKVEVTPAPTEEAQAEAPAEEKPAEAVAEVTEPPAAPAAVEPEPEVPPVEPEAVEPAVSGVGEEKTEQELSERIAQAPAPQPAEPTPSTAAKPGEWEYYLQDGRGPYESVQAAMDELGLNKDTRPTHNRWDRLSTALKEKILRRPKS
ncbi:hypothetical protein LCGC14_2976510 [marine sediment metagenome]|uniref:Uncharacterized protein n=1 Tax=marine sediment metagenome TaxID=412755 RepID=A0A0F8X8Q0_9ZZZZ